MTVARRRACAAVAIAAPLALAVDCAEAAFADGGNALDGVLAAAAALVVAYPHQCSLGGDLTALVRRPDGTVETVLSIGAAAASTDVARLRESVTEMPRQGPASVTVPGVLAGWIELAALGAVLGLDGALSRAAELALTGVPVAAGLARAIGARGTAIRSDPGLRSVFMADGRAPEAGETLTQPRLAATLYELAGDPGAFYTGELATRFAVGLGRLGCAIDVEDLAAHRAERPPPLILDAHGVRWWAPPPPAQGATALALLDEETAGELLPRARAAHAARSRLLGDPRGGEIDVDGLRHPRAEREPQRATTRAAGDTVAVTAVDSEGRSVALVQSVFQTFGAGLLEPDSGIVLHNRGSAFVLAADPATHDAHPGRLAPGHRPPHTLCPLLGESPDVRVALGCQGGRAQPLILAQLAPRAADPGAVLAEVLAAPRWVLGDRDLGYGSETILAETGAEIGETGGLPVLGGVPHDDRFGHVQVARATHGELEAGADPRADGRAAVLGASPCGPSTRPRSAP